MELGTETRIPIPIPISITSSYTGGSDRFVERRLERLLELNAAIASEKELYKNSAERRRVQLMTYPIESRNAFGYFGFMIGSMPLLAAALRILSNSPNADPSFFAFILSFLGLLTGLSGLGLGRRYVPRVLRSIENFAIPNRIALWVLVGIVWGGVSGAAGGVLVFLVGSIVGAVIGGMVGAITVPIMIFLYTCVRAGDLIDAKHFLPIALGITLSVCALVLGL